MANIKIKEEYIRIVKFFTLSIFALLVIALFWLQGNENGTLEFKIGAGISGVFAVNFYLKAIESYQRNMKTFWINLFLATASLIISFIYFLR
ncbi:MAG: hypothetical protein K0R93_3450 [Anaerosolibacter sp.]|jgi:hypothetical protein|uniref:hypothetical protein n=1 Tax=Anaerosolibacter sp. TaxID=1872527 RepID=UPI00262FC8D1|nr:hypothetical protein [Anaerosolibacter sp.]MDF2548552.1 hypothetical protein [Anaerosolibacter sp.]